MTSLFSLFGYLKEMCLSVMLKSRRTMVSLDCQGDRQTPGKPLNHSLDTSARVLRERGKG